MFLQQPRPQEVWINTQRVTDKEKATGCGVAGLEPGQRLVLLGPLLVVSVAVSINIIATLFQTQNGIIQDGRPELLRSGEALRGQERCQPLLEHRVVIPDVPTFTNPLVGHEERATLL